MKTTARRDWVRKWAVWDVWRMYPAPVIEDAASDIPVFQQYDIGGQHTLAWPGSIWPARTYGVADAVTEGR